MPGNFGSFGFPGFELPGQALGTNGSGGDGLHDPVPGSWGSGWFPSENGIRFGLGV